MVYCGRPSKGCQTCRNRRIKCDEGRPSCGQCIKSNRDCLGYRNENDLLFRNETEVTERRAKRGTQTKRFSPSSSTCSSGSRASTPSSSSYPDWAPLGPFADYNDFSPAENGIGTNDSLALTIPRSMMQDPEQAALCYFFSHFIIVPRHSEVSRGYLEYLLPLYANTSLDSSLSAATTAISLATFGNNPGRKHLMQAAHQKYNEALVRVNRALRDPVLAKQDDTLMTILLFSLFEESIMPLRLLNLTPDQSITATPETLPQWGLHTDGAIALIKMRGKEQLENDQSRRLFLAVRTQMIISHIQRSKPLDEFYDGWGDLPEAQNTIANRLTLLQLLVPDLRARAKEYMSRPKDEESISDVVQLMEDAKAVDEKLTMWPDEVPASWKFQTVATMEGDPGNIDEADIWPGNIDVYYDVWVASIWNSYRSTRIFAQAVVVRCIQWLATPLQYKQLPEFKAATDVLQQMANETCASVPFHMGYGVSDRDLRESTYPPPQNAPFVRPNHAQSVLALGGYFLLWPLFTSASVVTIPVEQRQWLKGRLMHVAKRFGINQANLRAQGTQFRSVGSPAFV